MLGAPHTGDVRPRGPVLVPACVREAVEVVEEEEGAHDSKTGEQEGDVLRVGGAQEPWCENRVRRVSRLHAP